MLKWSIATVCMGGTLEAKLQATARAGFRQVELFENDLTFFNGKPREVGLMARDLGLEIVALQPMRDFEAMPEPLRLRNLERARRKLDLMLELGTSLLCVCSNVSAEAIADPARAAADLHELAAEAAQRGCRIGYEALAWGRHVRDWTQAWDIVQRSDAANLGIVLDSFHICVRGNEIAPLAALPKERIALVQVADAPRIVMDPMALSRHHRCFPGQGDLPVADYLDAVLATGYDGPISLEIFNDQFRGAAPGVIALDGMRSLQMAQEDLVSRRRAAGRGEAVIGPELPRAPDIEAIDFIEFATAGAESERLVRELETLGFARIAHHRSKDVDLLRQNDISIVINRQQEGFSFSFYLVHGTSVCALALRVDDVKRTLERANALGAPTRYGRIGPDEALIPAIAGVENSLLYFTENPTPGAKSWTEDFTPLISGAASGRLKRIDQLSNAVRRSDFLTWSTFYKAVLGLEDEPSVELADPYGAFFSRALRSRGGALRIPLNIADGGPTAVTRFIENFDGGGVQQIAFATDDIFAFVEEAVGKGYEFLPIPDNYYDDLASRLEIDPAVLERCRELDILYDRHDGGEFFHIYTPMFESRFFFEIVQRRDYDLFGAANTPVRLAAQAVEQDQQLREVASW